VQVIIQYSKRRELLADFAVPVRMKNVRILIL
jgi:hypothetical protein